MAIVNIRRIRAGDDAGVRGTFMEGCTYLQMSEVLHLVVFTASSGSQLMACNRQSIRRTIVEDVQHGNEHVFEVDILDHVGWASESEGRVWEGGTHDGHGDA
ncbi:hypothetical protein L208DRAFT_1381389 [Tricholoma matsutake]|nr:hypothetical protein L208DRAFT_1381389 [Tricholoma matsutake 945]